MGRSSGDEMILSYNDVVLRRSDLGILSGPHYINDRIIEFYFSFLSSSYQSDEILLVPPSISFWIANCLDFNSLKEAIEPLNISTRKIVIFSVNDNEDLSVAEGGNHWSLLAYVREKDLFVHHDSYTGINKHHALKLYKAVTGYLQKMGLAFDARLVEGSTPQQKNGYDCGLYVMAVAKAICCWHQGNGDKESWYSDGMKELTSSSVGSLRTEILHLIKNLMERDY